MSSNPTQTLFRSILGQVSLLRMGVFSLTLGGGGHLLSSQAVKAGTGRTWFWCVVRLLPWILIRKRGLLCASRIIVIGLSKTRVSSWETSAELYSVPLPKSFFVSFFLLVSCWGIFGERDEHAEERNSAEKWGEMRSTVALVAGAQNVLFSSLLSVLLFNGSYSAR